MSSVIQSFPIIQPCPPPKATLGLGGHDYGYLLCQKFWPVDVSTFRNRKATDSVFRFQNCHLLGLSLNWYLHDLNVEFPSMILMRLIFQAPDPLSRCGHIGSGLIPIGVYTYCTLCTAVQGLYTVQGRPDAGITERWPPSPPAVGKRPPSHHCDRGEAEWFNQLDEA